MEEDDGVKINVHPLTNNPSAVWSSIWHTQKVLPIHMESPADSVTPNKVRFVCMSDTHALTHNLNFKVPYGDVLLHAGDFTSTLPHKYKIVIAGNHEISFDPNCENIMQIFNPTTRTNSAESHLVTCLNIIKKPFARFTERHTAPTNTSQYLTNCIYLEDSPVVVYGIKIYGSPWQPEFGKWAFNLPRGKPLLSKWNQIPEDTDILITHGPPLGHGDLVRNGDHVGCVELLSTVQQRVRPKYHVFGHIHEGYGVTTDEYTIFINASTCDMNYIPKNYPMVFDMDLPAGVQK
ncbi:hypothetical protein RI129_009137 [Pyrocoelia pectoralis]|uniref:Calcineurin-like phosphoesterase domain-containing protein n=1 Tax=Pyrocoelia pectoralis TaxID=417401 RepID=A0AAN7V6T9_9COLE